MNTSVIQETINQWQAEPEKAIMKPTVKGRSDGVQAIIEAGPFSWRMDVPPVFGGTNEAPSPAALLLGSLAGCAALFIKDTLAPQYGVAVESVEATVSCTADGRGALGMAESIPDLQDMAITIQVKSTENAEKVRQVYDAWLERCPVYLALIKSLKVDTTLEINPS
jgi:uncharacterized OsmC-like protein